MGRVAVPRCASREADSPAVGGGDRSVAGSCFRRVRSAAIAIAMTILIVVAIACGRGGSGGSGEVDVNGDGDLIVDLGSFFESRASADSANCRCRLERGLDSDVDECMMTIAPSFDDTSACLEQVAIERDFVVENLECASAAEDDFAECFSESTCSEDDDNRCFDEYDLAYAQCPAISEEVFQELKDCF